MGNEHLVYLSLGSNLKPEENIQKAIDLLSDTTNIVDISNTWQTPAVGSSGPDFLNAAISVRTDCSVDRLKFEVLQPVENQLGRQRTENKFAPRTIDIDILIYDDEVIDPEIWEFAHLAVPLAELIPEYKTCDSGKTLGETARALAHESNIRVRQDVIR